MHHRIVFLPPSWAEEAAQMARQFDCPVVLAVDDQPAHGEAPAQVTADDILKIYDCKPELSMGCRVIPPDPVEAKADGE